MTNCAKRNNMIIPNRVIIRLTKPKFIHVWEYKYRHD